MTHEPNSNITKLLTLEVALEYLVKQQGVYSGSNIPPEKRFYHDSGKHQGPRGGRFSEIGVDVDQHGKPLEQQLEMPLDIDPEVGEEREVSVVEAPESKEKSSEDSTLDSILSGIDLTDYSLSDKRQQLADDFRTYITKATSDEHGNNSESMRQIVQYTMDKLHIAQGGPELFLSPEDGGLGTRTNFLSRVAENCPIDMFGEFSERVKELTEDVGDRWGEWNRLRFDWDESNPPKHSNGFPMDYSRVTSAEESWRNHYDGLSNIVSTIEDRQRILNFIPEGVADRFNDFALNFDDKMPGSIKIFPDLDDWPEMKEEIEGSFGEFGEFTVVNNPTEAIIEIIDELYKGTKYGNTHSYTKNEWERSSNSDGAFLLKESIGRQLDGPIVYHQDGEFAESSNIMEGGLDEEYYIKGIFDQIEGSTLVSDFTSKDRIDNYVLLHKRVNRELMDYVFPQDEFEVFRGINDEDLSNDLMSRTDEEEDVDARFDSRFDDLFYPVEDSISQNPVSSYSLNYRTALQFASKGDDQGAVIRTTIHKDDVWSSFLSHAVHGNEYEMLVMGDSSRPTVAGSYVDLYQNRNSEDYYLENRGIADIPGYMYSREDSKEIQKAGRDKDKKIIIDAGENGDWIKIVRDMTKKDKDTNNLSKLLTLEVALEYMTKQDSADEKDYDPEGFHEGPRKGRYFKPGEREAGGPEVKVVQAEEALVDDDDDDDEDVGPKVGNEAFVDKMMVKRYIPLSELIKTLPRISEAEQKALTRQAALDGKGLENDATPITPNIAVVNDEGNVIKITTADGQLQSTKEFDPKYPKRGGKRHLFFSPDADDKVQVQWVDGKSRQHVAYSIEQSKSQSIKKFDKTKRLHDVVPNIEESINSDITNVNSKDREAAIALGIIHNTFRRVGKGTSTVAWDGKDGRPGPEMDKDGKFIRKSVNTFGVTSFQPKHILVKGQKVYLNFLGKSGQLNNVEVTDPLLKEELVARKKGMGRGAKTPVLKITAAKVNDYLKKITESDEFSAKNFRTYHATRLATDLIAKTRIPKLNRESFDKHMLKSIKNGAISTPKEWKEAAYLYAIKEHNKLKLDIIGDPISKRLSNTKSVCVSNYIDPVVFKDWDSSFEAEIQKYVNTRFPKDAVKGSKIKRAAVKPTVRAKKK